MKIRIFLLALVVVFFCGACANIPLVGPGIPPDQEAKGELFLTKGICAIRITADLLCTSGTEDPTKAWALAIERELKKAGWESCSPREANVVIYVTGLTRAGVPDGNSFVATVKPNGDFIAKRSVDNKEDDFAEKVVEAVNETIRETEIGWFLNLITGSGEKK